MVNDAAMMALTISAHVY